MNTQAAAQAAGQPLTPENAVQNTHTAELVRGETYFLGNFRFVPGAKVPVPQYIVDHLKENAVDAVNVEGETELKQKFKFTALAEDKSAPAAVAPRAARAGTTTRARATSPAVQARQRAAAESNSGDGGESAEA